MEKRIELEEFLIEVGKKGLAQPTKGDFPVRYGLWTQVTTPELTLELSLDGRLRYLTGRSSSWSNSSEYLKRTDGNDWVYYSLGEYADYYGIYGEYYLPCPSYVTNRPLGGEPFRREHVVEVLNKWPLTLSRLRARCRELPKEYEEFCRTLARSEPSALAADAKELHGILETTIPVLPPDARHVDYDVVPLIVADGCHYHCRFCCVKGGGRFSQRTRAQVDEQITRLRAWLGDRFGHYQGLFLGLQDALAADDDFLRWSLEQAFSRLGFEGQGIHPQLFLFGSVGSLLRKEPAFFEWLDGSPWTTFINVGFEAADEQTLRALGKPLSAAEVERGFVRMNELNALHTNLEVTGNFVLWSEVGLAEEAMLRLMQRTVEQRRLRGSCYLSTLMRDGLRPRANRRELLRRVYRLQRESPLPLYLYLIQRL